MNPEDKELLISIEETLKSIDKTFKRIEAREKGIALSGSFIYAKPVPTTGTTPIYDWSKEEDLK